MNLLNIPSEVWQRILFDWVTLPELIRFDRAGASLKEAPCNPLHLVFTDHYFNFSDYKKLTSVQLDALLVWFQSKTIYLRKVAVNSPYNHQWDLIFQWTGRTIHDLQLLNVSSEFFGLGVASCTNLKVLQIQRTSINARQLHRILVNNASTLLTLILAHASRVGSFQSELPILQIRDLSCTAPHADRVLIPLLTACPNLTNLSLSDKNLDTELAECIAARCKNLKCLNFHHMNCMDERALLEIANGCRNIECLEMTDCDESFDEGLREAILAMPHLQKMLLRDAWSDRLIEEISNGGPQRVRLPLRVVEMANTGGDHSVSSNGICTFTKAFPDLVALSIALTYIRIDACVSSMFEHSAKLRYLEVGDVGEDLACEILSSAGKYCSNLHTLNVCYCSDTSPELINDVLRKCTHLCKLIVNYECAFEVSDNLIRQRVTVSRGEEVRLVDWVEPSSL